MGNFQSFLNNDIARQIFSKYIYIVFWVIVIAFFINSYIVKGMYKYEPININQNSNSRGRKSNENNIDRTNKNKKILIIKIVKNIFLALGMGLIIYASISFILINIKYYMKIFDIYKYLFNIIEPIMILEIFFVIAREQCEFPSNKKIFNIVAATLLLPVSIVMTVHSNLCVDILIVSITLIIVVSFSKTKYYISVILILLGTHLIVFGNRYLDISNIDEILFALGTGLVTTGVCNVFTITETTVKQKKERRYQTSNIFRNIRDVLIEMFFLIKHKQEYEDWSYISYEDYKNTIMNYLKRKKIQLNSVVNNNLLETIEKICDITNSISLNEIYYVTNDIFDIDEVAVIQDIGIVFKNILDDCKNEDIKKFKKDFCLFFDKMRYLNANIPEIEESIYAMGKRKVKVEWDIGTMRRVWPDGKKVDPSEFYKNGNHLK